MSETVDVIRAELFKLIRRPAAWTLLSVSVVLSTVFGYLIPYLSYRSAGSGPMEGATKPSILASILPDQIVANALGGFPVFEGALGLVFGALVFGGEYGWGTVKTVLTQRPGRTSVLAGQVVAMAVAVAVTVLTLLAIGAAVASVIALSEGESVRFPSVVDVLSGYGVGFLILFMWASLGAVLGVVLRGVALPIGLGVVWALGVENLISAVASSVLTALRPLRDVLPGVNSGSLASAVMPDRPRGVEPPPGVNTNVGDTQALITLLVIIGVCLALALWTSRRRDVV